MLDSYVYRLSAGPIVQGPLGVCAPAALAVSSINHSLRDVMRARVYIDGFNVYYRLLKNSGLKWTDFSLLSQELLEKGDEIDCIRYFTADVTKRAGDEEAPLRQQTYFRALKTIDGFEIHKGTFLSKSITRPLVGQDHRYVDIHDTEEKGSDVNLASYLLLDAFQNKFDVALVLSQDTDLIEPLRMVTQTLGKQVVLGWMDKSSPGKKHKMASSFIRHINKGMLRRSQFPNPVIGKGGRKILRPDSWAPAEGK